jgi:ABC-type glutathione transport system ATPase component
MEPRLLDVNDLSVTYCADNGSKFVAVLGVEFRISAGEIVGLCGASGSGKTSLGLALLKLLPGTATCTAKAIRFRGADLQGLSEAEMRQIRGKEISIMYQEPALALNPVMCVGEQIAEVIRAHERISRKDCRERVWDLLRSVCLDQRPRIYEAYPHELSGGECHRIVIAQAVACRPSLVIADEPTAGLDAELKPEIIDLIARLRTELNVAFLLISHDRNMLNRVADRTLEMSAGRLHEARLEAVQIMRPPKAVQRVEDHDATPLIVIRGLSKSYTKRGLFFRSSPAAQAIRDVNLTIARGGTLGLVGPSGSGKSTLARCLALWDVPDAGQILFRGKDITSLSCAELRRTRPQIQLVVQDSAAAFNPNLPAQEIVEEPLLIQGRSAAEQRHKEVKRLFEETGLKEAMLTRRVFEFSGGERQRLAIARALALKPEVVVFDESTTGLDGETQQQILALLRELKHLHDLTYVVISHDLELIRQIADRVAVMRDGTIISTASVAETLDHTTDLGDSELRFARVQQAVALGEGA